MRFWVTLSRLADVVLRRRRDARLDEEVATHLALLRADYEQRGLTPADADLAARRSFGGVDQVKAHYRDARGWPGLASLGQDARFALRRLTGDRASTMPLVLVLALGIGVGHMFFTLTYAHTMRGLPIADVERVVAVSTLDSRGRDQGLSYPDFLDLQAAQRTLDDLAAFVTTPVTIADDDMAPARLDAAFLTASGFAAARVTAISGRVFGAADERRDATATVVLTERVWRTRYAGRADIVGRAVRIDGSPGVVVGVVSDRSGFPSPAAVFLPLAARSTLLDGARDARTLRTVARLRPEAGVTDAATDLGLVMDTLAVRFPASNAGVRIRLETINERYFGGRLGGWAAFISAGLIVLAVASTNAGSLLTAAASRRSREIAVRISLGASRGRVLRQLLIEAMAIAAVAAVAGLGVSRAGVAIYRTAVPDGILPYWNDYSLDVTGFVALSSIVVTATLVFALVPAVRASRASVVELLKSGGRPDARSQRARAAGTVFLGVQLGLAVVLVAQLGLITATRIERLATDPLLDDSRVMVGALTLPPANYGRPEARRAFADQLTDRLAALRGVSVVATASAAPVEGAPERGLRVEGRAVAEPPPRVHVVEASARYFAALGTTLVRGRDFTPDDASADAPVAIVNQRLAALHFPDIEPIGQRIALTAAADSGAPRWSTIVGVAPDIRVREGAPAARPIAYSPIASGAPASFVVLVRADADGTMLADDVRQTLRSIDPELPLQRPRSLSAVARDASWVSRVSQRLATTVCLAAFVLAVFGLYAVTSHRTTLRQREIGLRMAMGADGARIARLVVGSVAGALGTGLVLGLLGVMAWNRLLTSTTPDTGADRLVPLVGAVAALALTTVLGCLTPAIRAIRLAPAEALRRE